MIGDIFKALAQIFDRRFRRVVFRSIGLAILLLAGFIWGGSWLIDFLLPLDVNLPFIGQITIDNGSGWVSGGILTLIALFAILPVSAVIVGVFLEEIAGAVEAKSYSHLPPARDIPTGEVIREILSFLVLIIVVNALALVIYVAISFLAPIVFWLANGLLIGREYFHLIAIRRLPRKEAAALRRSARLGNWFMGVLIAIPLSIPILGLIVPVLGVAIFTHRFHRLTKNT